MEKKQIHLSISLEALKRSHCPGVSRKGDETVGLTSEEILEIMHLAGKCSQIKSIDITDFNPANEDYRTGLLACNLIYYFAMGYSKQIHFVQK